MFEREREKDTSRDSIPIPSISYFLVSHSEEELPKAIKPFIDKSHKSVWEWWYQEFGRNKKRFQNAFRLKKERVELFLMDETCVKIFGKEAYLFVLYEPFVDRILGLYFAWNADFHNCRNLSEETLSRNTESMRSGRMALRGTL